MVISLMVSLDFTVTNYYSRIMKFGSLQKCYVSLGWDILTGKVKTE